MNRKEQTELARFQRYFGVAATMEQYRMVVEVARGLAVEAGVELDGESNEHWYAAIEQVGLEG